MKSSRRSSKSAWRAKTLSLSLPPLSPVDGISGRLWDGCRPLFQVAMLVNPGASSLLLEAILNIAGERSESKRETTEGRLVSIIHGLTNRQGDADYLEWTIKTAEILRAFNENRAEDRHVTAQWIGKKLKSMSLRNRTVQGRSEILLSSREFKTLLEQYGCSGRESENPTQTLLKKTSDIQMDTEVAGSCRESAQGMTLDEFDREWFEEKAAILQFEAGLSRADAERQAAELLGADQGEGRCERKLSRRNPPPTSRQTS